MTDFRDYKDPTTAPDQHAAIERRENYVPWIWTGAAAVLVAAGLVFALA